MAGKAIIFKFSSLPSDFHEFEILDVTKQRGYNFSLLSVIFKENRETRGRVILTLALKFYSGLRQSGIWNSIPTAILLLTPHSSRQRDARIMSIVNFANCRASQSFAAESRERAISVTRYSRFNETWLNYEQLSDISVLIPLHLKLLHLQIWKSNLTSLFRQTLSRNQTVFIKTAHCNWTFNFQGYCTYLESWVCPERSANVLKDAAWKGMAEKRNSTFVVQSAIRRSFKAEERRGRAYEIGA